MRAIRTLLAVLAPTAIYVGALLAVGLALATTLPQTAPMLRSLSAGVEAAPGNTTASPAPAAPATPAATSPNGNSLQNPVNSGGFGNTPTTNALTTPSPATT